MSCSTSSGTSTPTPDPALRFSLPSTFFFLAAGMALALLRQSWQERPDRLAVSSARATGGPSSRSPWRRSSSLPCRDPVDDCDRTRLAISVALVGACVLPLRSGALVGALQWRPFALVGVASYSLLLGPRPDPAGTRRHRGRVGLARCAGARAAAGPARRGPCCTLPSRPRSCGCDGAGSIRPTRRRPSDFATRSRMETHDDDNHRPHRVAGGGDRRPARPGRLRRSSPAAGRRTGRRSAIHCVEQRAEFVGPLSGDGAFYLAVALSPDGRAEAYLCDGTGRAENFTGALAGDRLKLTSADGDTTLTATTTTGKVTGAVVLAGQSRDFAISEVQGVGGLYDFDVTQQAGKVVFTGGSRGGNTATLQITAPDVAAGTITLADGSTQPLKPMADRSPEALNNFEAYRVLIADDGNRKGNPKPGAKKKAGSGGSFTCPIIDI